jgi:hypothetical protein
MSHRDDNLPEIEYVVKGSVHSSKAEANVKLDFVPDSPSSESSISESDYDDPDMDLFSINIDDIDRSVEILSSNHQQSIKDLESGKADPEVGKAYQVVRLAVTMLIGTDDYHTLTSIISSQYRPSKIIPGTIGAFLFGCFQETYGDVTKSCSPLCISGINPKGHHTPCEHQIWVQKSSSGSSKYLQIKSESTDSNRAIVYVSSAFIGFTKEEIKVFRKFGVDLVQVMTTKDSKHHQIVRMTPLNRLPIVGKPTPAVKDDPDHSTDSDKEDENLQSYQTIYQYNWFPTIILIVLAVVLIGLLVYFQSKR